MNIKRVISKAKQVTRHSFRSVFVSLFPNSVVFRKLSYYPIEKQVDLSKSKHFKDRFELYKYVNSDILKNCDINYLEFGVYRGESIEFWSKLNNNNNSKFYGFDTFTGIPEGWESRGMPKRFFDTNGVTPQINDTRVSFVKGLFQQTLPGFLPGFTSDKKLVIHNDSDLYSSTLYVLTNMHSYFADGTTIIFDEFSDVLDEMRALNDYCSAYFMKYDIVAHTDHYTQVAVVLRKGLTFHD